MQTLAASADDLVAADPRYWDCPSLNTAAHIANSLGKPIALPPHLADALTTDWATEHEPPLLRWFARLSHQDYEQIFRDNTYNQENDFSENFVFSIFSENFVFSIFSPVGCSDWCWSDDVFVVVETHLGGDVRGNYGPAGVYRIDSIADSGFLDWVCGWFASPISTDSLNYLADSEHPELQAANDRLSIGYSSHPTSELRNLLWQGCEPVWSDRLNCHVARLADVPFAVRVEPIGPSYC